MWDADVHAKWYNKLRRVGEDNQKGTVVVVCLMTATTTRCLLNDNVCLKQRSERGIGDHHCSQTEWAVGFITATTWKGEGKGAEEQSRVPNAYDRESQHGMGLEETCLFSAFGYGAVKESGGQNRTLSSSVRLTRTAAKKQRPHKETKNRQVKQAR